MRSRSRSRTLAVADTSSLKVILAVLLLSIVACGTTIATTIATSGLTF
jgi:hypothetical protein